MSHYTSISHNLNSRGQHEHTEAQSVHATLTPLDGFVADWCMCAALL